MSAVWLRSRLRLIARFTWHLPFHLLSPFRRYLWLALLRMLDSFSRRLLWSLRLLTRLCTSLRCLRSFNIRFRSRLRLSCFLLRLCCFSLWHFPSTLLRVWLYRFLFRCNLSLRSSFLFYRFRRPLDISTAFCFVCFYAPVVSAV